MWCWAAFIFVNIHWLANNIFFTNTFFRLKQFIHKIYKVFSGKLFVLFFDDCMKPITFTIIEI